MITVYTDGSAYIKDMSGGWAWWVTDTFHDSGFVTPATNNQMEMTAVLNGLRAVEYHGVPVRIVSDSAYVVNCFLFRWYDRWRRLARTDGSWRSSTGKRVANQDLWELLLTVVENYPVPIHWQHCRGHGRGGEEDAPYVAGNDKADVLAGAARKAGLERILG